jgi:hypothetical protein
MDHRFPIVSVVAVGAASLVVGHLASFYLPSTLGGLPTPVLLILGMVGSVAAAVRWL